jgi:hypothetical protein
LRNVSEYGGQFAANAKLLTEVIAATKAVLRALDALPPPA